MVETWFLHICNQLNYLHGAWLRMDEVDWYVVKFSTNNFIGL